MKTNLLSLTTVVFSVAFFFIANSIQSQEVSTDIKLNTTDYYDVAMDGGHCIAVDGDNVYAIWQGMLSENESYIYFTKSTDGGETFSTESAIYTGPIDAYHVMSSIDVANNNIYIAWVAATNDANDWNVWFTKSTDGGTTFSTPTPITTNNSSAFPILKAHGSNVYIFYANAGTYPMVDYYFIKSIDNGDTWGSASQINDGTCISEVMFSNLNTMEKDATGNIYLAWTDGRNEDANGDIYFCKSTDGGDTFLGNVMVNDMTILDSDSVQHYPSIAVASDNNVLVNFIDYRLGSDDWANARPYIANSNDGGTSFAQEQLFSGIEGYCGNAVLASNSSQNIAYAACANLDMHFGVFLFVSDDNGATYGEHIPISDEFDVDPKEIHAQMDEYNQVHIIWKDSRVGVDDSDVYYSKYNPAPMGTGNFMSDKLEFYPNPANDIIEFSNFNKTSIVEIYSVNGKLVFSQKINCKIDINEIPAGMYFIKILGEEKPISKKLIKL